MKNFVIEKIGGTCMSRLADVKEKIIFNKNLHHHYSQKFDTFPLFPYGRIIVVSAFAEVTDKLIENFNKSWNRILREDYDTIDTIAFDTLNFYKKPNIDRIIQSVHYRELKRLISSFDKEDIETVRKIFYNFTVSYGEYDAMSELVEFIKEDVVGYDELVNLNQFNEDIDNKIIIVSGSPKIFEKPLIYYDRGYTEVTFSQIAVELKAKVAVIHKEFSLSSADPKIVKSRPIKRMSYDTLIQLADFGMKATHPKTARPMAKAGIELSIRKAFNNDLEGTSIGSSGHEIVISGSQNAFIINFESYSISGEAGVEYDISLFFKNKNMSYVSKSTDTTNITYVFLYRDLLHVSLEEIKTELKEKIPHFNISYSEQSLICIIGDNMNITNVLYQAFKCIKRILGLSLSFKGTNIQLIVERNQYKETIQKLHEELIK